MMGPAGRRCVPSRSKEDALATDLAATLTTHLAAALPEDGFDVVPGEGAGDLDVMTDEWTLSIERWPDGIAYLSIDDEPDDPAAFPDTLLATLSAPVIRALAAADRDLDGGLAAALRGSGDPLSAALADAMGASALLPPS